MDTVLRLAALCLLGALLAVLLRRGGGELALLLVLAVCGVAVALLLEPLGQLRDFWEEASAWGQLPEQLFQPLLKTVCIALICRTGSDLCRDAGEGALASVLETAGAVAAIVVPAAVPRRLGPVGVTAMKKVLFCLTLLLLCLDCAWAAELPDSVKDAVPPEAADILPEMDTSASHETLWQGLGDLWHSACAYVRTALETQASGAALLLGVVLLCSLAESCLAAADSPCVPRYVSVAGALAITLVAAGDFRRMMGLGVETMSQLEVFSKARRRLYHRRCQAGGHGVLHRSAHQPYPSGTAAAAVRLHCCCRRGRRDRGARPRQGRGRRLHPAAELPVRSERAHRARRPVPDALPPRQRLRRRRQRQPRQRGVSGGA